MTAFPTIVQTGTKPTLTWAVIHPSRIGSGQTGGGSNSDGSENMAIVNPPGTIIPTVDSYVTVQIIGTGVTSCQGGSTNLSPPTDLRLSVGGGPYSQLFYGTQADVDSGKQLYIKKIRAGHPGNGSGGPNGAIDPSGGVDDEAP
jgi:hypothetical protein